LAPDALLVEVLQTNLHIPDPWRPHRVHEVVELPADLLTVDEDELVFLAAFGAGRAVGQPLRQA
jgi:hypothetical protein